MARLHALIVSIAFLALGLAEQQRVSQSNEAMLLADLFKNYDPRVRPVSYQDDVVPVQFGIVPIDFFENRNNVFDIDGWLHLNWTDVNLRWNPAEYGGIKMVKVVPVVHGQSPVIWLPDVLLYRGRIEDKVGQANVLRAVINYDGSVLWVPPRTLKAPCEPEIVEPGQPRNVICTLKFGSWVHSALELNLQDLGNRTVDTAMLNTGNWKLADYTHKRTVTMYDCCPEAYISITATLKLTENLRK